ncbi:Ig-like domain-containing protein [Paraglaciecola arctica]|uniref:Dystroglycan-type cadherin-like domain-containing protein n=1 Tax=Paraglaciecola arctica BSs20135 TaxID=493475 RepID=K6YVM8_9ALTE|nr:tandem-95 repeat protein [Paraglaciecola arctica]GAC22237.1 hypothetical protein GARC_5302 [Paraglaciecola arctica BSs20135]
MKNKMSGVSVLCQILPRGRALFAASLLLLSLTAATANGAINSAPQIVTGDKWQSVGAAGFSLGSAEFTDIAFDSNDVPYVAYEDAGNDYKTTVKKFDGSAWMDVGGAGFSAGIAYNTNIAFNSHDVPYVVYKDGGNSSKATVMKLDGGTWVDVGTAGFSLGVANNTHIAFDSNDVPYVVYRDYGNDSKATVKMFDGSDWQSVGTAGFSAGAANDTDIAFDSNDVPYVVYGDGGNSSKSTVMKFDGGSWVDVGAAGFSADFTRYTNIAFDSNNVPYVVYQDGGNDTKSTVMTFDGSTWENVGTAGFSVGRALFADIAINSNDVPYVVFRDVGNANNAVVKTFNGSTWVDVGTAGFSAGTASYTSIAFDSNDVSYVVYKDDSNSDKATVMKFDDIVFTGFDLTLNEDITTPVSFFTGYQVSDEEGQDVTLTVSLANTAQGQLSCGSVVTGCSVTGGTLTLTGTVAEVNTALTSLTFLPAANVSGTVNLTVALSDSGGASMSPVSTNITVTNVDNDAPTLDINSGLTLDEGSTKAITASVLSSNDPDDTPNGLTYTISTLPAYGTLFVDVNTNAQLDDTEALAVSGTFTQQTIIDGQLYYQHGGASTSVSDSFVFAVADGGEDSAAGVSNQTFTLNMTPVNDAPQIVGKKWQRVGAAGFSAGVADFTDIAFDSNDVPYVVYKDDGNHNKATVKKFDDGTWGDVGTAGFSTGIANYIQIAFGSNDVPYVVYQDGSNGDKTTAMMFDGSTWVIVGTAGFSAGMVGRTDIALDSSDVPYVVYRDEGNNNKATVMKFDGSTWVDVGAVGFSAGTASYPHIAFDSTNVPYVVYKDGSIGTKATVKKFDGSTWVDVGTAGFSAGTVNFTGIAFDSNDLPYVVYGDGGNGTTVKTFDGSAWVDVGMAGFSAGTVNYTDIAFDSNDVPYVVYQDSGNGYRVTVKKFDGSTWVDVGMAGFSTNTVGYTHIAIGNSDVPYVVYKDGGNSFKTTVMKFDVGDFAGTITISKDAGVAVAIMDGYRIDDEETDDVTLSISLADAAYGTLSCGLVTGCEVANGTLTLSGTLSAVNAALGSLTFMPAAGLSADVNLTASVTEFADTGPVIVVPPVVVVPPVTNTAPVISGAPATAVAQGSAYRFTPSVSDADGDTVTFSISGQPSWMLFDTATGTLTGTPGNADVGITSNIVITVKDSANATASLRVFSIRVSNTNDAPVISGTPATTVAEGSPYSFTPSVSDADGDTVTFSIGGQPSWMLFDTATGRLSGTPQQDDVELSSHIIITVNDKSGADNATAKLSFSVAVSNVNQAPKAVADSAEFKLNDSNTYTLDVLSNDSDLDNDSLSISGANSSIGTVKAEGVNLTLTTQAGFIGQVQLRYTITDGHNTFADTTVDVLIKGDLSVTAPVITVPDDMEVNATGLYTKVDLGVATAVNSQGQSVPISLVDGQPLFRPGNNIAYWQAIDPNTGLTTIASQQVVVHPIISLGKDQVVVEGKAASIDVILNGKAPRYPVIVTLNISGSVDESDYVIDNQQVTIESGTQARVMIDIIQDDLIEGSETLTVSLDEGNLSSRSSQVMTIVEMNVAPVISLSSVQNSQARQVVTPSGGLVIISASLVDANEDVMSTQWVYDAALNIRETDAHTVELDPSALPAGIYSIGVTATDEGEGHLSTTQTLYLEVLDTLLELSDVDSDGDGIPDNAEGYGDSDQDGIPDFQDTIAECNVMPEQVLNQNAFLVEGEPGICLRKGNTLAAGETGGLQLTDKDIETSVGKDAEAVIVGGIFDYIASGLPQAGQNYQIVLPQIRPIPSGAIYRKYSKNAGWGTFIEDANNYLRSAAGEPGYCPPPASSAQWSEGLTESHWCVQLTIEDGGPNDNDGIANSTIVDPGGVAVLLTDNSVPVAQGDIARVKRNETIIIDVLENDSDADGDNLTIGVVTATFGNVTITAENQLAYQSKADFIGQDKVIYSVSDGNGGTDSSTVSMTVYANDAPIAQNDSANTNDRTSIIIDVLANDSDVDGDDLTIVSASVDEGSVIINQDNTLTYKPSSGFSGSTTIDYNVDDGQGGQASATVTVDIKAYQSVTVKNKSKGGSISLMIIGLMGLVLYRQRRRLLISKKGMIHSAAAVTAAVSMSLAAAETQWFMAGNIGHSQVKGAFTLPANTEINSQTRDDSGTSYSIGGGLRYVDISFILSYEHLGEAAASYTGEVLNAQQYHQILANTGPKLVEGISLQSQYSLWQHQDFSASVGMGLLHWKLDFRSELNGSVAVTSDSDTNLFYTLQMGYQLADNIQMTVKATRYNLSVNNVNNLALGLIYQF